MKVENADGKNVDLNESLTKADLVALVKHWRNVANNAQELARRMRKAIGRTMSVTTHVDRETLIKMAVSGGGWSRGVAEGMFDPDPEPEERTDFRGRKRMVRSPRPPLPIMSETFLYAMLGKEDARSILCPLEDVEQQFAHPSWYTERHTREVNELERIVVLLEEMINSTDDAERARSLQYSARSLKSFIADWVTNPMLEN